MDKAMKADGPTIVTQSITGLGGVGKTQLAAAYVRQHADEYDIVAWIRAEDGGTADLAELAGILLGPDKVKNLKPEEQAERALTELGRSAGPWLLVLDNLASPEQLDECRPGAGKGQVLVTTRDHRFRQFGEVIDVDVFDEETGADYLVKRTGRRGEQDDALHLSTDLGGLPLALSHAAAYCDEREIRFKKYLGLLTELPTRKLFAHSPKTFYNQTVASTWQVSIEAASEEEELARPILEMASYLAPEGIPRSLFEVLAGQDNETGLDDGLAALHRYSLIDLDDTEVGVHRLVQKVVRDNAPREAGLAALTALAQAFSCDVALPESWPLCEQVVPHVSAVGQALMDADDAAEALTRLLNNTCEYLLHVGGGKRAVEAADTASELAERLLGPEHPETLTARHNLARSYEPFSTWLPGPRRSQ